MALNHQDLKLQLAIRDAAADPSNREGPWYAAWSIHLDKFLARVCEDEQSILAPILCPQYPLVAFCDRADSLENASDTIDSEDEDEEEQDRPSSPDQLDVIDMPSSPHPPRIPAASAHQKSVTRVSQTPVTAKSNIPISSNPQRPMGLSRHQSSAYIKAERIRSTRIPDFLRILGPFTL